jgi:methylase of polypeptide subunit release factors
VVDIGCGCGAISLALAKALPGLKVIAVDQSKMACDLTVENAENLNLVTFCVKEVLILIKLSLFNRTYLKTFLLCRFKIEIIKL